ncbi:helix-turn-helix domain-containing protein [Maridesulfovibrio ferrireducens]|uniref:helix-turn-helix domain-containing protein n=1 Tax=Maridesulfovibrio ferrireducens TaxID=246191 RepID=UPI001A241192|nr:helix-turn-helix domain-containing protein [Maridesulfovibrio ferrireducens]MBI9110014.1 hypothetical protein [Maridesulfovibrio ferrireducens]
MSDIVQRFLSIKDMLELKQVAFCDRIGLTPMSYRNYTQGKGTPKSEILTKVCEEFNINGDWLLTGKGPVYAESANRTDTPETRFGTALKNLFADSGIQTTLENFAAVGGITVTELNAIMDSQMMPPASALRQWAIKYRVNMNFLIAQMGQPLLTREQYEQDGPLLDMRVQAGEDKYPRGCGDLYGNGKKTGNKPLPEVTQDMLSPGAELPLIGLAQCGVSGWSLTLPMAATSSVPKFHKDMIAAMAIGDSMVPAGINPGNIVYCDPKMKPIEGEPVFIVRRGMDTKKEGEATLKLYMGEDDKWIYLKGWLTNMGTHQKDFEIKQLKAEIKTIAPVVMIRRRI